LYLSYRERLSEVNFATVIKLNPIGEEDAKPNTTRLFELMSTDLDTNEEIVIKGNVTLPKVKNPSTMRC